jgi:hypothetical protein
MKEWFEGKSVAVVGNAMSLFDKTYGNEIDSHDVVVRLNKAAMLYTREDCEVSHGKRTDVWMFWNTSEYKKHFHKTNVKKMHMGHQGRNASNTSLVDHIYPVSLYNPLKAKAGKHNNPTTGLMALDYILHCNPSRVSVYGYDWKETPTFTDPDRKKDPRCPHDYKTEKEYCEKTFFSRDDFVLRK